MVWNDDLGTHGGWDANGCTTVITEASSTLCECSTFGTYSVVAELVEEPWLPPEHTWLTVAKYLGFALSLLLLLVFIGVIATTGWLRDMFHVFRLNTGVCVFLGHVVMLVSQNESLCMGPGSRDANIALSALQQYFYGAAAFFILFEAFATFQVKSTFFFKKE